MIDKSGSMGSGFDGEVIWEFLGGGTRDLEENSKNTLKII